MGANPHEGKPRIAVRISRYLRRRQTLASPFLPALQLVFLIALAANILAARPAGRISGRVTDPQGATVSRAEITVSDQSNSTVCKTTPDAQGYFFWSTVGTGKFSVTATSPAFDQVALTVRVEAGAQVEADLQFRQLASQKQAITVVGTAPPLLAPDPSERVVVHDEVLDANPGRPGAPISIPGLPTETASGGIKAPPILRPGRGRRSRRAHCPVCTGRKFPLSQQPSRQRSWQRLQRPQHSDSLHPERRASRCRRVQCARR